MHHAPCMMLRKEVVGEVKRGIDTVEKEWMRRKEKEERFDGFCIDLSIQYLGELLVSICS